MSDTLVVLQTVERELTAALERRDDVAVLAMLRFAVLRDRGRILLALAGAPDARVLEEMTDEQRRTFASALRRAADAADPGGRELELRLADVADTLAAVPVDEDGELDIHADQFHGLLSALEHALHGSSGCMEPDEWQERREAALEARGEELGLL